MATVKFNGDEQLSCTANLTAGLHSQLIFLSVFNSFLSVTAFLENTVVWIALHKESSLSNKTSALPLFLELVVLGQRE